MPQPIQLSRAKGWSLQRVSQELNGLPAVNVSRPGLWGNPFIHGQPSGVFDDSPPLVIIEALSFEQCLDFYERMVQGLISPEMLPHGHDWMKRFRATIGQHPAEFIRSSHGLCGRNLACWCDLPAVGEPDRCHRSILLRLAN